MKPLTAWQRLLRADGLRDPRLDAPGVRIHDLNNGSVSLPFDTFEDATEGILGLARRVPLSRGRAFALRDGRQEWMVSECEGRISILWKKEMVKEARRGENLTAWDRLLLDDYLTPDLGPWRRKWRINVGCRCGFSSVLEANVTLTTVARLRQLRWGARAVVRAW